jgi:hypothetical protein
MPEDQLNQDPTLKNNVENNLNPTDVVEDELKDVDNPKSYKHFQRIAEQRLQETQSEREQRIRLEEKVNYLEQQQKPVEKVEDFKPPVRPQKPVRPNDYDPTEAVTNLSSASAKYDRALQEYFENVADYQLAMSEFNTKSVESKIKRIDEFENQTKEQQRFNQNKAKALADFQRAGGTPQESQEAFELLSSPESMKPEFLLGYFKYLKGVKSQNGINNVQNRIEKQNIPSPLNGGGGNDEQIDKTKFTKSKDYSYMYKLQ